MQSSVTEERWKYLGGSDCPAIMGISPFTTRMEMLQYKAQIRDNEFDGNSYTEYGNEMEGKIRDYINETKGYSFHEDKKILEDGTNLPIRYHADGISEKEETLLEVKTTSRVFDNVKHYEAYIVQMLLGMVVYDYRLGILAVYERPENMDTEFDPERLKTYEIKFEDYHDLWDRLEKAIRDFRYDLEYLKNNPMSEEDELPSRNGLVMVGNNALTVGDKALTILYLLENEKVLTTAIKTAKAEMLKAMEERGIKSATFEDGMKITYVAPTEDKEYQDLDKDKLIAENPDLAEKYMVTKTRKGKSAYVRVTI